MTNNLSLTAAVLVASLAVDSAGQDPPQRPPARDRAEGSPVTRRMDPEVALKDLDKNGDGRISRQEAGEGAFFNRADANSNGFVTQRELARLAFRQRSRTSDVGSAKQVFPANLQAAAAKRKVLKAVPNVTGRNRRPPNIVLILADDLGYADSGAYGSKAIPTPHIDALAEAGMKLTNAYVTAASCSPSRAGLLTGRYQQRFGFEFNTAGGAITHRLHRGLDPKTVILADILQKAGYATGMFGKWHLGTQPQFHPLARGFDEFYGFLAGAHSFLPVKREEAVHSTIMRGNEPLKESEYLTDAIAREAVKFIGDHADQPFFAYVPFNAVHTPIEATRKYQDRFPNTRNETRRDYYAMTSALDDGVGSIVAAIEKHKLTRDTLVIFLNDNGGPLYTGVQSNKPLKLGKLFLFEGGIRVPMVLKWPAVISSNQVFGGMTSSLDVFPTVCAASGIKLPQDIRLDGVDLTPFASGQALGSPHHTLFWSNGPNKAVRHHQWKLVKSGEAKWLYDLSVDIGEKNNLIDSHAERLRELESLLDDWQQEMSPPAWPSKPRRRKVEVDGATYEMNI